MLQSYVCLYGKFIDITNMEKNNRTLTSLASDLISSLKNTNPNELMHDDDRDDDGLMEETKSATISLTEISSMVKKKLEEGNGEFVMEIDDEIYPNMMFHEALTKVAKNFNAEVTLLHTKKKCSFVLIRKAMTIENGLEIRIACVGNVKTICIN
jgi:hypothetical protein